MDRLFNTLLIIAVALMSVILAVPFFVYISLVKQWKLKDIIAWYKFLWDSK